MDPNITSVKLPCGCIMNFNDLPIKKNGGKFYIQYYICKEHQSKIVDSFLRRTAHNKYKIINDHKEERKVFHTEEKFFSFVYTRTVGKCNNCKQILKGKNILEIEHVRNTDWDLFIQCPKCGTKDYYFIDSRNL